MIVSMYRIENYCKMNSNLSGKSIKHSCAKNYFPSLMLCVVYDIISRGDKLFLVGVSFAFDVLLRKRGQTEDSISVSTGAVLCKWEHFLVKHCRAHDKSQNLIRVRSYDKISLIMLRIMCAHETRSISTKISRRANFAN